MFKNAMYYRINSAENLVVLNDAAQLEEALSGVPEGLPTGSQWRRLGFTTPYAGFSENLVWSGPNFNIVTLAIHERDLKGTTIKEHIAARVRKIEEREGRKCYRKEVAQIRDDVEAMLLPKAFIKHSYITAMITGDMIIIDSSGAKKSEDLLDYLRSALGTLSVRPLTFNLSIDIGLTEHMQGKNALGDQIALLSQATLVNSVKAKVGFKDVDLTDDEPQQYIQQGFRASELALAYLNEHRDEQFRFRINDQVVVKAIKFNDLILDTAKADADGDQAALIDGSLIIVRSALLGLADQLIEHLGEDRVAPVAEVERDEDEIRAGAIEYLQHTGDATVQGLQRAVRIGYNRAARMLDEFENIYVTAADSHGRRQVMGYSYTSEASPEDLRRIAEQAEDLVEGTDTGLRITGVTMGDSTESALAGDDEEDEWDSAAKRLASMHTPADEDDEL
jgi:recombination associated protein RdgC